MVLVLYDYEASDVSELSILEGETLRLCSVDGAGWGTCVKRDGSFGVVPMNFTESAQLACALCDSSITDKGLAFQKGDILHVFIGSEQNDSWLHCMMDGREGSVRKSDVMFVKRARAVANYTSGDISFCKGDRVYILGPDSKDENLVLCIRRGDKKTGIAPMSWLKYSSLGRIAKAVPAGVCPPFVLKEGDYVEELCEAGDQVLCQRNGVQGWISRRFVCAVEDFSGRDDGGVADHALDQILPLDPFDRSIDRESQPTLVCGFVSRYDFTKWYPVLNPLTFASAVIPLSPTSCERLCDTYEGKVKGSVLLGSLGDHKKLDDAAKAYPKGFFVRMSSRSPKDAVLESEAYAIALGRRLPAEPGDLNADGIAFYVAVQEAMRVHSVDEALILLSKSTRIWRDLKSWKRGDIVLREWVPILPHQEWRCFVVHGRLTCISQYVDCLYFAQYSAPGWREWFVDKLRKFMAERLAQFLPQLPAAFVLDLVVPLEAEGGDITIIELNPFYHKTGACLFDWTRDRELLLNGDCVVRILTEPPLPSVLAREFGTLRQDLLDATAKHGKSSTSVTRSELQDRLRSKAKDEKCIVF